MKFQYFTDTIILSMMIFSGKHNTKKFIAYFGLATAFALMSIGIIVTSEYASDFEIISNKDFSFFFPRVVDEFTGVYSFFLLIPIIILFFKKYPLAKDNLTHRIPVYLVATVIVGLTHTSMMYFSRVLLYPFFNLGNYDYGYIPYRVIMEYFKQIISFSAVLVVFTFYKINKEKEAEKIRLIQLEEQLSKTKLRALRSQLNPHFLFNTLNMISSVMYENPKSADKMISNLSELLRATLSSATIEFHSLKDEIETLNLYFEIMKARFSGKLSIVVNINTTELNAKVPWFILQPLVENSIKYCMNELKPAEIVISSSRINEKLYLSVKDNGPGFPEDDKTVMNSGVGLSNIVERLENIYGSNHSFAINNLPSGGAEVVIEFPFSTTNVNGENE